MRWVAVVGCGDDSSTSSGTTAANVDNTATTASGGSSSGGEFTSSDCAEVTTALANSSAGLSAAVSGGANNFDAALTQLKAFEDVAPDEIKDDFATIVDAYSAFAQALSDAGVDPNTPGSIDPAKAAQLAQALQSIDVAAITTAGTNISTYFSTHCNG